MTHKALQYIAKTILLILMVCQLGNAVLASEIATPLETKVASEAGQQHLHTDASLSHDHQGDQGEQSCCVDEDDGLSQTDLNLDLYLPVSNTLTSFQVVITSETNRRFINLKPIFPPIYLVFQSFIE